MAQEGNQLTADSAINLKAKVAATTFSTMHVRHDIQEARLTNVASKSELGCAAAKPFRGALRNHAVCRREPLSSDKRVGGVLTCTPGVGRVLVALITQPSHDPRRRPWTVDAPYMGPHARHCHEIFPGATRKHASPPSSSARPCFCGCTFADRQQRLAPRHRAGSVSRRS